MQRISYWKILLSYLSEIKLEERKSEINPEIIISVHKGRIKLSTSNAVYSFEDLYYCFTQSFDYIDVEKRNIQHVLVLGYGLGSVAAILSKTFNLYPRITGVEIDPEIIKLHQKYGLVQENVSLIQADAVAYMREQTDKFDLICIDVFQDHRIPLSLDTAAFLECIAASLNKGGVMIFNRMDDDDKNKAQNKAFQTHFSKAFPAFQLFRVRQNLMHIGYKSR